MKLHSVYLNPFQPYPERELDNLGQDRPRSAIEDNLSRSVFSALAHTDSTAVLATFLQALAQNHGSSSKLQSPKLQSRIKALAENLRNTDPSKVEFDLQTWPSAAMEERENLEVLLIGISSSHEDTWTHDKRRAHKDPRPDAWIYVPGKMLLVFEWKNDEHPLDATQISEYAHCLGLLKGHVSVPRAAAGMTLATVEEAQTVQKACADLVLAVPWYAVKNALQAIQADETVGDDRGRWLCGQAAEYVRRHIRPPYRGIQTILQWLKPPDDPDRRDHLRTLVRCMGNELKNSAEGRQVSITFDNKNKEGKWDLIRGAGSAVYVKLKQGGHLVQRDFIDRKVDAVFWFQFAEDESQRIGLDYYLQASGSHSSGKCDPVTAWNNASDNHSKCAELFQERVEKWIAKAPPGSRMDVSTVRFNGKKRTWQGGGIEDKDPTALYSSPDTPQKALDFLRQNREKLWRFPRVGPGAASTIEEAALQVRKPALSLKIPLDTSALASRGGDGRALQDFLQNALAAIAIETACAPN